MFGRYGATGEAIASDRDEKSLDFYTDSIARLKITSAGQVQVANNLSVQNGKGLIRNIDGTQSKKLSATTIVSGTFAASETKTFNVTWSEAFSSTPEAYVGNVLSGAGGWAEVVMTVAEVTTTGAKLYVYNPRSTVASPSFSIKVIAIGPQ
jgi:hypothetical protein